MAKPQGKNVGLSVAEAAVVADVSEPTIYKALKKGILLGMNTRQENHIRIPTKAALWLKARLKEYGKLNRIPAGEVVSYHMKVSPSRHSEIQSFWAQAEEVPEVRVLSKKVKRDSRKAPRVSRRKGTISGVSSQPEATQGAEAVVQEVPREQYVHMDVKIPRKLLSTLSSEAAQDFAGLLSGRVKGLEDHALELQRQIGILHKRIGQYEETLRGQHDRIVLLEDLTQSQGGSGNPLPKAVEEAVQEEWKKMLANLSR